MRPLDLQSEKYQATGNLASEGVLNQLGRPVIGRLTLLLRETVQNSADARLSDDFPVRYSIEYRTLSPSQSEFLRNSVLLRRPQKLGLEGEDGIDGPVSLLEISDRGTVGLGGPTRADLPAIPGESRDFVDLLRNIGQAPAQTHKGGTYGYGKAASFLTSRIRTICVHTHSEHRGQPVSRFIGVAMGEGYQIEHPYSDSGVYTGRHWWGRESNGIVEPVEGTEADQIALSLGMQGFAPGDRGTTIAILQPFVEGNGPEETTAEQAMEGLAGSIAWNFWPLMVDLANDGPRLEFRVGYEGREIPVPDPGSTPPLAGFVNALRILAEGSPEEVHDLQCQRPQQQLGQLALHVFPAETTNRLTIGEAPGAPVGDRSHHVALMRAPRLVVKYLPGPRLGTDLAEYAGVFLAERSIDSIFAAAEPPAHDDWITSQLAMRTDRTFVNVAFRRIEEHLATLVDPGKPDRTSGEQVPLGAFSERLGKLIPGIQGSPNSGRSGRTGSSSSRGGAGGSAKPALTVTTQPLLTLFAGQPAIQLEFRIQHAMESRGTRVSLVAAAVLERAQMEKEPPAGAVMPEVLQWQSYDGITKEGLDSIIVESGNDEHWRVLVRPAPDAQTALEFMVESLR